MALRRSVLFLLFLFIGNSVFSQAVKSFSTEPAKFILELTAFFEDIESKDLKKEGKEFMEQFTLFWNSGKVTEKQKTQCISTSNLMLKKKLKALPHFKNYLSAYQNFINSTQPEKSFNSWQASLDKLINRPTSTQFVAFIEVSDILVTKNLLYKSNTTAWKSSSSDFTFDYDTVPKIIFPSLNLVCYACGDSANIYNTKGIYYPVTNQWVGQGGKVNWKRAGFDENIIYAELGKYQLNTKMYKYTADTVKFYQKNYFAYPLLGSLTEKVMPDVTPDRAQFPQFESFDKRIKISNIFENIDYDGGFSMHGASLIGTGNKQKDAILIFYRDKKKFVVATSKAFSIRKDMITSQRAAVSIMWDKDSISHPGLILKYLNENKEKKKELVLFREENGIGNTPFFDSYHKVELYVEGLYWVMNEPKIDFKMISSGSVESEAHFESMNYFSEQRYEKLQGIDNENPISLIKQLSDKLKRTTISVNEFAKFMGVGQEIAEAQAIRMATQGFLSYDEEDKMFTIKDKVYHFLNARKHKTDYDALIFKSVITGKANATLSLLNFDMTIRGINAILLSDTQQVYVFPKGNEIILKKNRDFTFEGRVHAGLFDLYGKTCSFEYDKFKLNLPMTDSLSFSIHSFKTDDYGENPLVRVKTVLENLNGELIIDHPNNKSGLYPFPQYPSFNSKKESYVYYDRKSILNGVYNRSKFYYHVNPFVLDTMDHFKTDQLHFNGYLVSAGIFPDIDEPLKVQPDYSLGFVKATPEVGLPAYGGKGIFNYLINLSHRGFRGDGKISYLTSTLKSNDFIFYPDSMNAEVYSYELKEQVGAVEYPPVKAEDVYVHWMPYQNVMIVKKRQKALAMFNGQSKLNGSIAVTPGGVTGEGTMEFPDAELDSKKFEFKQHIIDADTSDFRLKSFDLQDIALSTKNFSAHVDFQERKGLFKSNGAASKVEFPVNQYICYMDEFDWFMDKEEIELANNKSSQQDSLDQYTKKELMDLDIHGSEFISMHPAQDSLRFFSKRATYNRRENIIHCKDVKMIKVADAAIFPNDGKVTILKKAEMEPLDNAQIFANTTTKYHVMYNAIVSIYSRKNYNAVANYDYIDETGLKEQISFSKVGVDTTLNTYANGQITDSTAFRLSPDYAFVGSIKLSARNEFLNFDGSFKIKHDCDTAKQTWVRFESAVNPNEIYIPISTAPKDVNNGKIVAAIMFANDTNQVYSAFLKRKFRAGDAELISASGFLTFDKITKEYRIGSKEKLKQISLPGNYLSLNRNTCITYGEGKIDLSNNMGQVKMETYGNVRHYIIPDSANMNVVMALDFFYNDDAIKLISSSLEKNSNLGAADLSSETYTKALAEILGTEKADKLISEINLGSFKRYPSELVHTFFMTNLQFRYNKVRKSYVSEGQISICNINKTQINKSVYGIIEIRKKKSGDVLTIYLEPDKNEWYFFTYENKMMSGLSSNPDFAKFVTETKPDNRVLKVEKGPNYSYYIATEVKKKDFLKKVQTTTN